MEHPALADLASPDCIQKVSVPPLCLSNLNARLYCVRSWYLPDGGQVAIDCYSRLHHFNLTREQIQSACIGGLAYGLKDDDNKTLCKDFDPSLADE
jgi:hypothetical protein